MKFKILASTIALIAFTQLTQAATLEADYQLQNTLDSSLVDGIPSLTYLNGTPVYASDTVDNQTRQILNVSAGGGPQATLDGFVSSSNYSIVLLASFNLQVAAATKLIDFKDLTSDSGLYINNGLLDFFDASGATIALGGMPLITNGYGQIVLTRDGATSLTGVYVNGAPAFSFTDTSGLAVINSTNSASSLLSFFIDDNAGLGGPENTSGNIARIRLYDGALTADEVAGLDRIPSVPEPNTLALFGVAGGIIAITWRRKLRLIRANKIPQPA